MRNLIIMGVGRSGTSMTAALFRNVPNVFMGYRLLDVHKSNPHGFYEDVFVNTINNLMILDVATCSVRQLQRKSVCVYNDPALAHTDSLWLVSPDPQFDSYQPKNVLFDAMNAVTENRPFCLKDPRFVCTWPAWQKVLPPETGCLVVFRHPVATINSMVNDCRTSYNPPVLWAPEQAAELWLATYRRILNDYATAEDFFFISYEGILQGKSLSGLVRFAEQGVDANMVTSILDRSSSVPAIPSKKIKECLALYDILQEKELRCR